MQELSKKVDEVLFMIQITDWVQGLHDWCILVQIFLNSNFFLKCVTENMSLNNEKFSIRIYRNCARIYEYFSPLHETWYWIRQKAAILKSFLICFHSEILLSLKSGINIYKRYIKYICWATDVSCSSIKILLHCHTMNY